MTVALGHPVEPLAAATGLGFALPIHPCPPPADEPGWRPAGAAARDPVLLEDLLARIGRVSGVATRAVAATWQLEKEAWFAATAALAGVLVHGALPPLERTLVRDSEYGWVDAIAVPGDDWEPAGAERLAVRLEALLAPLVDALASHRPARALWRSAGDRLAQGALWCGEALGDRERAWRLAADALAAPTRMAAPAGFELRNGEPFRQRTGCCLSHRSADGIVCPDCPRHARRRTAAA